MASPNDARNAALLRAAATLIESRQPAAQALLTYGMADTFNVGTYLVRFKYPGIVSVYAHDSGALIVRSRPGRPTVRAVPRVRDVTEYNF